MQTKRATYISLSLILVIDVVYFAATQKLPVPSHTQGMGPQYFPDLLAIALAVLCVLSFYKTYKQDAEKVELKNFRSVVITIVLSMVYILIWQLFGFLFYAATLVYVWSLMMIYAPKGRPKHTLLVTVCVSVAFTAFIYLLFGYLMNISF